MKNNVLCCCHNVTVEDVKNQIKEGVTSFEVLQDKTGIGTDCPPCTESSKQAFQKLLNEKEE